MLEFLPSKIFTFIILFNFIYPSTYANIRDKRIVGGSDITTIEIPYIVSLQSWLIRLHQCGGSIIATNWILTAAHCQIADKNQYYALVKGTASARNGNMYNITRAIRHPQFNVRSMDYDIALLKLDRSIAPTSGAKVIKLPRANEPVKSGEIVRVSGWGWNEKTGYREQLKTVHLDIIDHKICYDKYKAKKIISNNMICAARKGKDACSSDSGGPMTVYNDLKLVGIVSWGAKCADIIYPGVYTKVSAFISWIEDVQKKYK